MAVCVSSTIYNKTAKYTNSIHQVLLFSITLTALPDPVTLAEGELNSLGGMVSMKLAYKTCGSTGHLSTCEAQFDNILVVKVEICPKKDNVTPSLTLDEGRLVCECECECVGVWGCVGVGVLHCS